MYTSVKPNTNKLGLMNYWSIVLTFDTGSYWANKYSLIFDTDLISTIVSFHKYAKMFASDLYGHLQRLVFCSPL